MAESLRQQTKLEQIAPRIGLAHRQRMEQRNVREGRLRVHPFVPQGQFFVMADTDHPEVDPLGDWGGLDGSVLLCHPYDEPMARNVLAGLGEHFDVNEALTALRRRVKAQPLLTERERARRELWGNL